MGRLKTLPNRLRAPSPRLQPAPDRRGEPPQRRSMSWTHTGRWKKERAAFIKAKTVEAAERGDLLRCVKTGVVLSGRDPEPNSPVLDHIIPHRGDEALFWDQTNWQVVAKSWHDSQKQSMEKRGLI